jgi:hypothetical protein
MEGRERMTINEMIVTGVEIEDDNFNWFKVGKDKNKYIIVRNGGLFATARSEERAKKILLKEGIDIEKH